MKNLFLCLLLIAALANNVHAQDEYDALRYSLTPYQGTARGMGIGGALGSIGADFSSLSVNPAGIGIYKSSELLFSPSLTTRLNESEYLGTSSSSNVSKFNFTNFGIVIANKLTEKTNNKNRNWRTFNFAIGMNRLGTFKNEYVYTGKNYSSSLIEKFADDINRLGGINAQSYPNISDSAAYETYLIDRGLGPDSNKVVSFVPFEGGLKQSKKVEESGGMNEYVISAGANYFDKIMLGATLGLSSVHYKRTLQFDEEDLTENLSNNFKYMNFTEQLSTTGTGINLKLGVIYKPSPYFRIGISYHSPTHIELNDASSVSMVSHTDSLLLHSNPKADPVTKYTQSSILVLNYALNTPYKFIISGMGLFGKYGFLTADIEYVDYASMKYNYGIGYEKATADINQTIKNTYKEAINFRIGAEARISNLSLRGGFAYYGAPSKKNTFGNKNIFSGGIGYRQQYWFIDASYAHAIQTNNEIPYTLIDKTVQAATIDTKQGIATLTLGVKF